MSDNGHHDPVARFVDSLLQCSGQLMVIVNHMACFPGSPDAPPAPEVLRRLLVGVVAGAFDDDQAALDGAATTISRVSDAVADEIYLVDPDEIEAEPASGDDL